MEQHSVTADTNYAYRPYDVRPDPSHRPMYLAAVLEALGSVPRGAPVLDAGCGGGDFAIGLAEAGYRVLGCDLSPTGVAAANRRGIGTFAIASVYDDLLAPFEVDAVGAVVAVEVIEHLYSPYTFARRAFDALVPGGTLVITTPYWGYLKNVGLALANRMDRSLTTLWEGGHIKHFSRATLNRLMTDCGFEPVLFRGCAMKAHGRIPGLWNGMMMSFKKPRTHSVP
jgi:2-polyprenyl-6-hydroxyphenyl methylase/3-demethylubiquinone-9 3-methyltransferase